MAAKQKKADGVFEGGGVKGIGLVGAVAKAEELGYQFENVAGTSAGAIVAALVAAGYNAQEMKEILQLLNYENFKDPGKLNILPLVGPVLRLVFKKGLYLGEFIEAWLKEMLAEKGVHTFGDLVIEDYQDSPKYRYKLRVIASDITSGEMLVLPQDISRFDLQPDDLEVARAVRMSACIPFFFEPVQLKAPGKVTNYIVDGGVLSNYPIWLFDEEHDAPAWPTFGFKLVEPQEGMPRRITGPVTMLTALFATMMEAHDARYITDHNFARTIPIPTLGVKTTDFDLPDEKSDQLYQSGYTAAAEFFQRWDFQQYISTYRQGPVTARRERI